MSIKENYYKLSEDEFDQYLKKIKEDKSTLHLFKNCNVDYFYYPENEIYNKLILLSKKEVILDNLINSFSSFGKGQILESLLIEEVIATNEIENINSTRHDIYYLMNNLPSSNKTDIIFFTYKLLLTNKLIDLYSLEDLSNLYKESLLKCIDKKDYQDGKYFRKNSVVITDGIKVIHKGFDSEAKINDGMSDFLNIFNSDYETYLKLIITHFMLEIIHPYYDGNGRFGRLLFSIKLFEENNTLFSFLISKSLAKNKNEYYKAFKSAEDIHEFGSINEYIKIMLNIFIKEIDNVIDELRFKFEQINNIKIDFKLNKSQLIIFKLLKEGTILSTYGLSIKEIINVTKLSKRAIIYALNSFKAKDLLYLTKISKFNYYKVK